jgi:hypothetical protein
VGLFEQERVAAGAPGGFSYSTVQPFASRGSHPYGIRIAADAAFFDDDLLLHAAASFPANFAVEVGRLYQFSWAPDPKVLIDIASQVLLGVPINVLSTYLYDVARKLWAPLSKENRTPVFEVRVERTPTSKSTTIKIVPGSADQLRRLMREVPEILRAEGQAGYWNSTEERWEILDEGGSESLERGKTP